MSLPRTSLFFISLFFLGIVVSAQETQETSASDSIYYKEKYGIRVGIDLSKPLRSVLDEDYTGLELIGDYRLLKNWFAAAEIGTEQSNYTETNLSASTNGSYIKLGANYNAYNNWIGMSNEIFVGLRYGFSTFTQELDSYAVFTRTPYFDPDIFDDGLEFSGLTASWAELQLGLKAELITNVYLSVHVQLKRKLGETRPPNFDNLYIPGFGRTYDDSTFGAGFGYAISYLIPIYKKTEKQKNFSK